MSRRKSRLGSRFRGNDEGVDWVWRNGVVSLRAFASANSYRVTRRTKPATIRSTDLISLPMLCAGLRWLWPAR